MSPEPSIIAVPDNANRASILDSSDEPIIKLQNITRGFPMGDETLQVLKGITLNIYPGEYVAIIGPSGSGKTTLMNILGCLDTPTTGEYFLDGVEVSQLTDNQLSQTRNEKIGFVFQTFNLLPRMTALDNVALPLVYAGYGRSERRKLAEEALRRVELGDRLDHRPNQLSGGQRQRVAIARAIVTQPAMVLADEPTGNLDSRVGSEIVKLFERLNSEGVTMIVITHERSLADKARRQVEIVDGLIQQDNVQSQVARK
jgi:putative ABC transport system ATP-binding protein